MNDLDNKDDLYEAFRDFWAGKTAKQIEKEIYSFRRYMDRHSQAYAWHGKQMTPPGTLADGDKMCALKEALEIRQKWDEYRQNELKERV